MLHFRPDKNLCISCGACARDCLPQVIQMVDQYPTISHEEHCMRCLHCLAVCPTGAVSILNHTPAQSRPLKGNYPAPDQLETLFKGRRSVRQYRKKNVDPVLLKGILNAASQAPTGGNSRKLLVTVIDDIHVMNAFREAVYRRLAELTAQNRMPENPRQKFFTAAAELWKKEQKDGIFRHAPHCVLVSNAKDATCVEQDPLIYLSYFELLAQTRGLGTVWCGLLYWCLRLVLPEFLPRLGIPETHVLGYAMLFGYPAVSYHRTVEHGPAQIRRIAWPEA